MIETIGYAAVVLVIYFIVKQSRSKMIANKDEKIINAIKAKSGEGFKMNDETLMRLAGRLGGRLSVKDVITQTTLSENQAKEKLENLLKQGKCEIKLDEVENTGVIYYYFS